MEYLIVVAHPAQTSFTMAVMQAYVSELEALGHGCRTRDLYRMGFDPVLEAREISGAGPGDAAIASAQDDVRAADVLTVIYPLWWLSMPAILKGYIDRVFARGFAYESDKGVVHGHFSGKKAVLITLSGAPLPLLVGSGNWNAVQVLQDTHMFRSAGFDLVEHLHFDEVAPGLLPGTAARYLAQARSCARRNFG